VFSIRDHADREIGSGPSIPPRDGLTIVTRAAFGGERPAAP
jgi:hypothetical protein